MTLNDFKILIRFYIHFDAFSESFILFEGICWKSSHLAAVGSREILKQSIIDDDYDGLENKRRKKEEAQVNVGCQKKSMCMCTWVAEKKGKTRSCVKSEEAYSEGRQKRRTVFGGRGGAEL